MAPEPPVQQPLEPSVQAHEDEDKAYNRGVPWDDEEFQQTEAAAALPRQQPPSWNPLYSNLLSVFVIPPTNESISLLSQFFLQL
jgi:hypothetical protein